MKEGQALCTKCGRKPEKREIIVEEKEEKNSTNRHIREEVRGIIKRIRTRKRPR